MHNTSFRGFQGPLSKWNTRKDTIFLAWVFMHKLWFILFKVLAPEITFWWVKTQNCLNSHWEASIWLFYNSQNKTSHATKKGIKWAREWWLFLCSILSVLWSHSGAFGPLERCAAGIKSVFFFQPSSSFSSLHRKCSPCTFLGEPLVSTRQAWQPWGLMPRETPSDRRGKLQMKKALASHPLESNQSRLQGPQLQVYKTS